MNRQKAWVWCGVFLLLIIGPTVTWPLLRGAVNGLDYGQRNAAYTYFDNGRYVNAAAGGAADDAPPADAEGGLRALPRNLDARYNAALPYKKLLVRFNSRWHYALFRESANPEVVVGTDGWLFFGDAVDASTGRWTFREDELQQIAARLTDTAQEMERRGKRFVLFIAPNKETIYPDHLPGYIHMAAPQSPAEQLADYLRANTEVQVVFPVAELMQARQDYPGIDLYHRLDTHWNEAGAYIGARALAGALGRALPPLGECTMQEYRFTGSDLTNLLGMPLASGTTDYCISGPGYKNLVLERWDHDTEIVYHDADGQGTLFVMRDSFGTALAEHLSPLFAQSVYRSRNTFAPQQVFEADPDDFVLECAERALPLLADFSLDE